MKTKRPDTLDLPITDTDMTDSNKVMVPLLVKVCNRFGLICQFCKWSMQHPSTQESDWMDRDWNVEKTKAKKLVGETSHMSDWDLPSPQYNPDSKPEEIDEINIDRFNLYPDYPWEELLQIVNSLIPPSTTEEMEKMIGQKKTDIGTDNNQQEGEGYEEWQRIYTGQLIDKKVTQVQTSHGSVIKPNKEILRVNLINLSVENCWL